MFNSYLILKLFAVRDRIQEIIICKVGLIMVKLLDYAVKRINGAFVPASDAIGKDRTIAYRILSSHNTSGDMDRLKIKFDAMASHDITYVGIIQTARASGMDHFPLPYVLTNCHNSLCAVGGTINEDDHAFGLSAAKKYGGEFVPAHQAVIHSYMREMYAGAGKMILGSDSHTRYGAFGTLAIGEGGPELVKQLLNRTYDIPYPRIIAVELVGKPRPGVGPQDVALSIIGAVFKDGFVKNAVLEFVGDGIKNLAMDYRCGIDVMTTETGCLSSVWETDDTVKRTLAIHGRENDYSKLCSENGALYDGAICVDLSLVRSMIALPFHPSNAMTLRDFLDNASDVLHKVETDAVSLLGLRNSPSSLLSKLRNGQFYADQGVIAGCSGGTFQNLVRTAEILADSAVPSPFRLSVYPSSQPVMLELLRTGNLEKMISAGVSVRSAFCGPCFGAGDVPSNGAFSIRHSTRNFPNREGSRPADGQIAYVALMDARSIAATAVHGGALTPADEVAGIGCDSDELPYNFDGSPYSTVWHGISRPLQEEPLIFGPNITDWPKQIPLPENLLITIASAIYDPVTTTDELIPSGETSSYRSNPEKLSEFALSRKDPLYVSRAKAVRDAEALRRTEPDNPDLLPIMCGFDPHTTGLGSAVMAIRPGDGSAREQAASCQRVLGGVANICEDFATKRYRSNVINWGMLPFTCDNLINLNLQPGDRIYISGIRNALENDSISVHASLLRNEKEEDVILHLGNLSREERDIILSGCLINYYTK